MRDETERGALAAELRPAYAGRAPSLFRLALRGGALTLLTLGLHRFWYLTRLRRFHWSALSLGGEPLEYTGRPAELLLGFLVALVVLGAVLGAVNLGLAWGGLVAGFAPYAAFNAATPVLVPLGYFAAWKARRYRAARTRWRGVRFGMTPGGAWGFALRGALWWLAVAGSLGLAWPAMQVALRKRVMNATRWGDLAFRQGGDWRRLMRPWLAVWAVAVLGVAAAGAKAWSVPARTWQGGGGVGGAVDIVLAVLFLGLAAGAAWLLWQRYAAAFEREMTGALEAGDGVRFASDLRAGRLLRIRLGALLAYAACGALLVAVTAGALADASAGFWATRGWVVPIALYVAVAVGFGALRETVLVRPLIRAYAEALTIRGAGALDAARQRPGDRAAEAGGFAEALDVDIGV